jgi:hypothetical protein
VTSSILDLGVAMNGRPAGRHAERLGVGRRAAEQRQEGRAEPS